MKIDNYKELFLDFLEKKIDFKEPKNLYEPITYILHLGGKRLRPILVLMSCKAFGGKAKDALYAALAIEVFHNFSLIHDDIMDQAPLRRGNPSVHNKWNINTGILSGDAMMILAYQYFENYEPVIFTKLAKLFSKTALEVCEGQQFDIDFETLSNVSIKEYLIMIEYKTAVLVAAALKMGAIIAQAPEKDQNLIYDFGLNLGIAFQLQDDYLDVFADADFGKQRAGDIIENKKTWLYLKALELASYTDKLLLKELYNIKSDDNDKKVREVISLFEKYNLPKVIKEEINFYTEKAFKCIDTISMNEMDKNSFKGLGVNLMNRSI